MKITGRQTVLEDLTSSLDTLRRCYGDEPDVIPHLPDAWRDLLATGALIGCTLEDQDRPAGSRILALGASVCITDAFAAEVMAGGLPQVSAHIIRRIRQGHSPVLEMAAIRRANVLDGLNVYVLHNDHRQPAAGVHVHPDHRVREKHIEHFFHMHRACRIKAFFQEVYGDQAMEWMRPSGLKMRTDYNDYYHRHPGTDLGPDRRPYLYGLTREEAAREEGSRIFQLFVHAPARFHFTSREQDLLRHALAGDTDEELARTLDLSLSTVKRRWSAIYDCVAATDDDLLPGSDTEDAPGGDGRRGAERRRHLLNYLREHAEELHPVSASR